MKIKNLHFFIFLAVILVPGRLKQLRETRRIHFHHFWYLETFRVSSYLHFWEKSEFLKIKNLIFSVFLKDLAISDCRFEFYVKNCIYSQLETSGNPKFDQNISKISFAIPNFGRRYLWAIDRTPQKIAPPPQSGI